MSQAADPIDEIFWEAAHRTPGPDRQAYLDLACGDDSATRQSVERLLRAHPKVEAFLERPFAGPAPADTIGEGVGTAIGPYRLLEQIGEGGMGLVFMAEQTHPVRRTVALKLIKPGMDSRQVVARFEAERQALALMDHPNIAKVLDAGTTASGRPFFVMELVRGIPITEYCDQARLTVRQRLLVFVQVCRAVQHAHTKGVIHRDLKPSNVLVTSHDGTPVPLVIDFGVAKALDRPLTDRTLHTGFAQMVGTPLYMSPEQAEFNQFGVDTRSDVYSLGVLLYELLTGVTPFDGERLRAVGYDEFRRILREEEPPRPSARLSTLGAVLSTTSERRGVDSRKLTHTVSGELDWIVLKALEKNRTRRYETASDFAGDVQHYLHDEPVEACLPSAGYRLRKFARRNRRALATAGVVALALVVATVVSVWQAVAARDAQRQAEADRDRAGVAERQALAAERNAATDAAIARDVNDFLQQDLLGQVASVPQPGQESRGNPRLTVREALDRAAARIGTRFQDQPLQEASIRTAIGRAYISLGLPRQAVPHLKVVVELYQELLGPDDPVTVDRLRVLARAYTGAGQFQDGIALGEQLWKNLEKRLGPDNAEVLGVAVDLAVAYRANGEGGRGVPILESVLERRRVLLGETHQSTLGTKQILAANYGSLGRFDESIKMFDEILSTRNAKTDSPGASQFRWWVRLAHKVWLGR